MDDYRNLASISGIGMTGLSRASDTEPLELAVNASTAALADAGLRPGDLGAVLTYHMGDSCPVNQLGQRLGVRPETWTNEASGGGSQSASIVGDAAMLITSGMADHVLVYRALNGRSGTRMNQAALNVAGGERQFTYPYGFAGPVNLFALAATRWMHDGLMTPENLSAVVRQSRLLASRNPRAVQQHEMTPEEYENSPFIATPLRRVDCCQETDGAAAIVLSRRGLADTGRPDPLVHTALRGSGPGISAMDKAPDPCALYSEFLAEPLWRRSGLRPRHIGLAMIYDAYSPIVLKQIEDLGLTAPGEAGALFRSGDALPDGRLPVNPNGGLLSEGYVHGLNNVIEAVRQLRGDAGAHQIDSVGFALCTGFGGSFGSVLILQNADS